MSKAKSANDKPEQVPTTEKAAAPDAAAEKAGKAADNNDVHEHHFEEANAGAALTYPMQCSALRKNGFVVMKGRPCKIIDMSTSKTGKHGHAKVKYTGVDIFTGAKYDDMSPSTHNVDVPNVKRDDYTLINVADGFLVLMNEAGDTKEDIKLPEGELGETIESEFEAGKELLITILTSMGTEAAIAQREAPRS
ncbi:translation initiation factor eIF5A [Coemansia interrupta]|uniref:Translation initiation factor eIF5A n=1 Tax=Coemansia interrupta TaxID=1126814 RepID=A0A9W8HN42_9FUNG|nr:translation initiation factor eIF5A [Coemansia interrupta]